MFHRAALFILTFISLFYGHTRRNGVINLSGMRVETRICLCFIEETDYLLGERLTLWSSRSELKGRRGVIDMNRLSRILSGWGFFSVCLGIPRD